MIEVQFVGIRACRAIHDHFQNRHYGFYCDMIKQGTDTAFNDVDTAGDISTRQIIGTGQSVAAAVSIIFVTGSSTSLQATSIKSFEQAQIGNLLADPNFQSSNTNTAATSSAAFIDGMIINRVYI